MKLSYTQAGVLHIMKTQKVHLRFHLYWWQFFHEDGSRSFTTVPGNGKTIQALERNGHLKRDGEKLLLSAEGSL